MKSNSKYQSPLGIFEDHFDYDEPWNHGPPPAPVSKTATIRTFMHYSDSDAGEVVDVFGREVDDIDYVYSDRLQSWDFDKYDAAHKHAKEQGHDHKTAIYYECMLSYYFDKPVDLVNIKLGCNRSSGYDYKVYGYRAK